MTALRRVLPGIMLTAISLLLFAYVGYGEATRVYLQIRMERIDQLGATLQTAVGQFAKSGLPLDQFGGFERRSQQVRTVDPAIMAGLIVDVDGRPIFCEADATVRDRLCRPVGDTGGPAAGWTATPQHRGLETDATVRLPIRDKFGVVGSVLLHVDQMRIKQVVDEAFYPVFIVTGGLFLLFTAIQLILWAWRGEAVRQRWLTPLFLGVLAVNLAVLTTVMFDLYRKGTEGQAEALARSMAARISAATEIGIPLSAFSGIDATLAEYRRINPNIAAISLLDQSKVLYSVEDQRVALGLADGVFERLTFDLPIQDSPEHNVVLSVELPVSVVLAAMATGARNFLALFFGCAVFALMFLRAVREGQGGTGSEDTAVRLALLRPAYFLGIFADALSLSMLPEIAKETVAAAGLPSEWVSLPFTLFFVGLTGALLPASYVTERIEVRKLFLIGAAAVGGGLFLVSLVPEFWSLCLGRAIGGVGQGTLLVAVQAYAFDVVGSGQRTRAAAVQVMGYNGGLIVGTGLGGLLAVFNPDRDVLFVGGLVAVAACLYIVFVLPALPHRRQPAGESVSLIGAVGRLARAPDFMAVLGLVGITSKFALAGVAMFAMPLVLHQAGYQDDEVGQALMVFAVVTYLITGIAPRLVGRLGSIDGVLTIGMVMLALGIGLLGLLVAPLDGAAPPPFVPTWVAVLAADLQGALGASVVPVATGLAVVVAVAALGVGQGLIAAPVVARVADSRVASTVGRERTLAVYRLAERAGHILGPTLVGPVLLAAHGNATPLTVFAVVFAGMAVLYGIWSIAGHDRRGVA